MNDTMAVKRSGNHGGAREGAGRKVQSPDGQKMSRRQVSMDATTADLLGVIGAGNISEGIRIAARVTADVRGIPYSRRDGDADISTSD